MRQVKKMGPIQNVLGMLPGMPKELKNAEIDDREIARVEAIICSMTPAERREPSIINGSRRLRIARGSGVTTQDVNALLKQFKMVQQMMRSGPPRGRCRSCRWASSEPGFADACGPPRDRSDTLMRRSGAPSRCRRRLLDTRREEPRSWP